MGSPNDSKKKGAESTFYSLEINSGMKRGINLLPHKEGERFKTVTQRG